MIKPLLVFSNAYDMPQVKEALKEIPCDQLHLDFFKYPLNYEHGQKFFLEHKEYTHYLVQSPDLIPQKDDYLKMIHILQEWDYDVYGPCANVDTKDWKNHIIACNKLPELSYENRRYRWVSESQRQYYLEHTINTIKTKFNGLAFAFIKRELLEQIKFTSLPYPTDERPLWEAKGGYACDLAFMHWMDYLKKEVIVDLRFKWVHNRYGSELLVGKREPKITFIPYDTST